MRHVASAADAAANHFGLMHTVAGAKLGAVCQGGSFFSLDPHARLWDPGVDMTKAILETAILVVGKRWFGSASRPRVKGALVRLTDHL